MFYLESNSVKGRNAEKNRRELAAELILKRKGRDLNKTSPHSLSLSSVLFTLSMEHGIAFISNSSHA